MIKELFKAKNGKMCISMGELEEDFDLKLNELEIGFKKRTYIVEEYECNTEDFMDEVDTCNEPICRYFHSKEESLSYLLDKVNDYFKYDDSLRLSILFLIESCIDEGGR